VCLYRELLPDVLLMDIQMPEGDGLSAAERILAEDPGARIVFLTTFSDDEYIVRALRLGAKGYLIKQEVANIAPALRSVMAGQSVLGDEVLNRVDYLVRGELSAPFGVTEGAPVSIDLTDREGEIIELIAEGLDNAEIASRIYISEGTIRNHISAILQKLGLKNRTQLAVYYYRHIKGSRR
jgi:DNA-binding NarL/FixJ family response regulator